MTCLKGVEESGEGRKFVGALLSYVNDEIKSDKHENIVSNKWWT